MKLTIISHAYLEEMYLPVLESMANCPNVELTLICPDKYKGVVARSNESLATRVFPIPIRFGSRQGSFIYRPLSLAQAIDRSQPDILLHEQEVYAFGSWQIAAAAAKRSIPLVMFVWENVHRCLSFPRRLLARYVLSKSSGVLAGSLQAKTVHRDWGFKGPIAVIPQMGVNVCANPNYGRRGGDSLRVCFAGRLQTYKGIDCLLRAVAILSKRQPGIECTIAGCGPELKALTYLVRELGIHDRVQFCGHLSVDAVRELLRRSDVLVLPSRRTAAWEEQFGRVLSEAMAEATVVVGSKTGSIPEVIGYEDLLFEENDCAGLADVLERLATHFEIFLNFQRGLWQRANENYRLDHLTSRRVEFLREVLEMTHR